MLISFIIPAFNESENIGKTLESIAAFDQQSAAHTTEVIVVDNGSTDNTPDIAKSLGATVIVKRDTTIAGLRNTGAAIANGEVFAFLDADVILTPQWNQNIPPVLEELQNNVKLVTGSHGTPPESNNWFLKYWFTSIADEVKSEHLGSAHMIMSRALFEKLDGFDETLVTAEDYDICQRAKRENAEIINNKALKVFHVDYPTTIPAFIRREAWHGLGDCASFNHAIKSKPLIASLLFFALTITTVSFWLAGHSQLTLLSLLSLAGLLFFSSWMKCRHSGTKHMLVNTPIFVLYYTGRLLSIIKSVFKS